MDEPLAFRELFFDDLYLEHRSSHRSERVYGPTPSPSMGEGRGGGEAGEKGQYLTAVLEAPHARWWRFDCALLSSIVVCPYPSRLDHLEYILGEDHLL